MLKRQRPQTPPPGTGSFTMDDSLAIPDIMHNPKRRRTQPPVLDGPSRGWPHQHDPNLDYEDDSDPELSPAPGPSTSSESQHKQEVSHQYKSTNEMLHELHTLNQHRLAFAGFHLSNHDRTPPFVPPHSSIASSKSVLSDSYGMDFSNRSSTHNPPFKEVKNVHQHYHESNKLLGAVFLARKRERDC